jgi:hypothetical protein
MKPLPALVLAAVVGSGFYANAFNIIPVNPLRQHHKASDDGDEIIPPAPAIFTVPFKPFGPYLSERPQHYDPRLAGHGGRAVRGKSDPIKFPTDAVYDNDPAKKLFWRTIWGGGSGSNYGCWCDPNPLTYPAPYIWIPPDTSFLHIEEGGSFDTIMFVDPAGVTVVLPFTIQTLPDNLLDILPDPIKEIEKKRRHDNDHDGNSPDLPDKPPSDPIISPTDPIGPIIPPIIGVGGGGVSGSSNVPEPSTWIMMIIGFIALGAFSIKRMKNQLDAA